MEDNYIQQFIVCDCGQKVGYEQLKTVIVNPIPVGNQKQQKHCPYCGRVIEGKEGV